MAGPLWPRARRGSTDEALIRAVYEEHGNALLAYATRLTGDRAAAEDVVQETLIRAWRHSDALVNGKGSVRGWLLTVARNIITDRYRARAARPPEVSGTAAAPPVAGDHADSVVDTMTVLGALDRLSPEHRDVLTELYYRQHSVAEAADRLGIPAGTVKSRSHYALKALRAVFTDGGAEEFGGNRRSGRPPQQPGGLREVVA
ncbi:RNA polymerase sigma-70 factor (ECF subfamily) [Streptomyces sp. 3211.6]|uniref:sigma-70 family RNA polymerase sigma factor n=1 Tax=Streptomyces sp. 3211.6 TaxID=1938845 RepID=UPI000C2BB721|nr:sigma-70 family RNA polymerase sigma factor [Streptomyces sp. 3211.6]RKT03051.1 RNA polymerase sigma-70 factor (ECF subfamily) [Streptomyces sp. 3211.6]